MDTVLYWVAAALIKGIQLLPLNGVARFGRGVGWLVWRLDARHRRVAEQNIGLCFPELSTAEVRNLSKENFRRIGENFACAVKTSGMSFEQLRDRVRFDVPVLEHKNSSERGPRYIAAIGHFGNFELFARFGQHCPNLSCATTYRGLRQPSLNRLLQSLRIKSGCLYFERRSDAAALRTFMQGENVILGLLSDQHAGDGGIPLPFFGRECSTSAAPAVLALRYHARLLTGFCFRTGLGRWTVETGPEIRIHNADGTPRELADIMLDVNRAFEAAVRRDPANWFWVHNRWKRKWRKPRAGVTGAARQQSFATSEQNEFQQGPTAHS